MTAPEWLSKRGGALRLASDGRTWYVLLSGEPQYSLVPYPVEGKCGATVKQTNNGRMIESKSVAVTADDAIKAGLEDLRKALGW